MAAGIDPVGNRPQPKAERPVKSGAPTFGECADQHIGLNEKGAQQQTSRAMGDDLAQVRRANPLQAGQRDHDRRRAGGSHADLERQA